MKKNKKIEYIFLTILFVLTFFNSFIMNAQIQRYILSIFLIIYVIICRIFIKTKKIENVNKKSAILLVTGLAIMYVAILYVIGIFVGFYKNSSGLSVKGIYSKILPYIIIVVCTEIIRQIFITKEEKKITIITTIILTVIEISMFIGAYNIFNLDEMLALVGYICLPAISVNILGNYMIKRYGIVPNLLYRVITTIYIYIFGILPDIYMFFQSLFKIIFPYIVYLIIDGTFEKDNFKKALKDRKISLISIFVYIIIMIGIVMLVSCRFKYGIMVIGSSSMSGSINKGDVIIFEKYNNQELQKGQVIVFNKDDTKVIHRIENIQVRNNQTIYYTKGDNNQQKDEDYRTNEDIIGIAKFRIIYIGWPTIWINNLFKSL